jgi:hypothetical protein
MPYEESSLKVWVLQRKSINTVKYADDLVLQSFIDRLILNVEMNVEKSKKMRT